MLDPPGMDIDTGPRAVAVVTGAANGIGAAIARRLAGDGLAVALVDRDAAGCEATAAAIAASGGTGLSVPADVSDSAEVAAAVASVADSLGPPTVLVNDAGIAAVADVVAMSDEQWDDVLAVNLRGAFAMARAVCPHIIRSGWGRVVSISSISALGDAGRIGYAASKAGLIGFTKTLALELGPHGGTANAIAPGFIVSDMTAASARRMGRDFAEHQRIAAESIAVRRVGQPEDVAHAASYLVSPGAGFVTGQVLYVAGDPVG
jgi:3-oxoacyl-[acyl-carrier protein] reductase